MGTLSSAVTTATRPGPTTPRTRRAAIAVLLLILGFAVLAGPTVAGAATASSSCAKHGCVDVVAVNGLIDGIEADYIVDTLASARRADGVVAVVLQFDSRGSAVSDARLDEVATAIRHADIPVSVWIGPSGAQAAGGAAELVRIAASSGIAPGASIGDVGTQRLSTAEFGDLFSGRAAVGLDRMLSGEAAVKAGLVTRFSPTLGLHIVTLDGVKTETRTQHGQRQTVPLTTVRFSKLPLSTQLFHTVASPSVAYLLVTIGLGLLLFEFFTAGIGIAGVVGAVFSVLGAYGVAELPHTAWAIALLVASFVAFAIDVQTGIPRAWTVIGMAGFVVSSLFLLTDFRPTWIALGVGVVGIGSTMFSGMPAMVRTRFATPTIDRDWLVGETGTAETPIGTDGSVALKGALWPARVVDGAARIDRGATVRAVAVEGVLVRVEPTSGS